jgi:uncharacterized protein YjiS (DUF1127 family)
MLKSATHMISAADAPGREPIFWPRVSRQVRKAWSAYWQRRAQAATMAVLSSLDDRTLKDLGLHRSEIGSLVYGTRRERRL